MRFEQDFIADLNKGTWTAIKGLAVIVVLVLALLAMEVI